MTLWSLHIDERTAMRYVPRFMLVGLAGTPIDVAFFSALHVGLGMPALIANTLSFSAGGVNNCLLHRYWTLAHRQREEFRAQFLLFALASLGTLLVNNACVLLLAPSFHLMVTQPVYADFLAKGCAAGVSTVWNLVISSFWTFRSYPKEIRV